LRTSRPVLVSACSALALAALLASATLGCAAVDRVEHGVSAKDFAGAPLSPTRGRGQVRFGAELQYDPTLVDYVAKHGNPDYFYIVDHQKMYLFYVRGDQAAMFERVAMEASEVTELGRIPGSMLHLLPADVKKSIVAQRATAQRRAQREGKTGRARIARTPSRTSPPASQAAGGVYIGGFETASIIARMRAPLTAADPGVQSWQKMQLRGGKTAWSAKVGGTHSEVRDERVAFTVRISESRGQLPGSARLAIKRVNDAIFAARADAVTQKMMALAERSAADRTGRTAFSQRVAGRTVRKGRRVSDGVFAYSIHP
jgi:hypothetical protein